MSRSLFACLFALLVLIIGACVQPSDDDDDASQRDDETSTAPPVDYSCMLWKAQCTSTTCGTEDYIEDIMSNSKYLDWYGSSLGSNKLPSCLLTMWSDPQRYNLQAYFSSYGDFQLITWFKEYSFNDDSTMYYEFLCGCNPAMLDQPYKGESGYDYKTARNPVFWSGWPETGMEDVN